MLPRVSQPSVRLQAAVLVFIGCSDPRLSAPCPTRSASGRTEAIAPYAGEAVGAVRRIESAAAIAADVEGASKLLRAKPEVALDASSPLPLARRRRDPL